MCFDLTFNAFDLLLFVGWALGCFGVLIVGVLFVDIGCFGLMIWVFDCGCIVLICVLAYGFVCVCLCLSIYCVWGVCCY